MSRKGDDKQRLDKLRGLNRKRCPRDGEPALCPVRTASVDDGNGKNTERKNKEQPPQPPVKTRERHTREQQHSRRSEQNGSRLYPHLGYALRCLKRTRAHGNKYGKYPDKRKQKRGYYHRTAAEIISAQVSRRGKMPEGTALLSGDAPPGAAVGAALVGAIIFHSTISVSQ